jgi:hypothetical protein
MKRSRIVVACLAGSLLASVAVFLVVLWSVRAQAAGAWNAVAAAWEEAKPGSSGAIHMTENREWGGHGLLWLEQWRSRTLTVTSWYSLDLLSGEPADPGKVTRITTGSVSIEVTGGSPGQVRVRVDLEQHRSWFSHDVRAKVELLEGSPEPLAREILELLEGSGVPVERVGW